MKADFKILVLSAGLLFSSLVCGPVSCEAANASGNGAMTPAQCAAAMKDLQQQSASLSQQLRSCKTNAVCAPLGVRLNRITQQLLSLKRKCAPALPTGASTAPVKKTASAPSDTDGIDLKDASGEVLDLKASWPDIPEFGSADLSGLSASMDTALLPQKAQAAGDGLPICPRNGAVFCPGNLPCPEKQKCVSDIPFPEEGWLNDCMANVCGQTDGGGGGCPAGQVSSGWWIFKKCAPACGGKAYDTAKKCCVNGIIVGKCGQKTKYAGAFEDVDDNRDTIIAAAKKYNIPATVLAGVVFTERSSTFYETLTDPIALYVTYNPSFGLTQVSVGIAYMMDNPKLIPTNYSKMTFKEREKYLIDLAKNMPMDLKKAYKHALEADPKTSINYSARYLKFLQDQRGVKYPSDSLWVSDYSRGLTMTTTELSRLGKIYDQNQEELSPIIRPEEYPECGCSKP